MMKFIPYFENTGELITSENYLNFKWVNSDCHILFSVTKRGKGAVCHFTSDKAGLRKLKQALNEWCEFCFDVFSWCKMIVGLIEKHSVESLVKQCNFHKVCSFGKIAVYIRRPQWVV